MSVGSVEAAILIAIEDDPRSYAQIMKTARVSNATIWLLRTGGRVALKTLRKLGKVVGVEVLIPRAKLMNMASCQQCGVRLKGKRRKNCGSRECILAAKRVRGKRRRIVKERVPKWLE